MTIDVADLCPAPPLFENMEFVFDNRRDGGEVRYKCQDGYTFNTDYTIAKITCHGLMWDSYPPPCVGKFALYRILSSSKEFDVNRNNAIKTTVYNRTLFSSNV